MLTLFGVRPVLKPVESLQTQNYSLAFALTEVQAEALAGDMTK